jgi:hypothetical protein
MCVAFVGTAPSAGAAGKSSWTACKLTTVNTEFGFIVDKELFSDKKSIKEK